MNNGFGNVDPKDLMRAQLDQMMGLSRNSSLEDQANPKKFFEKDVCKFYLCGCSPWKLLEGTKSEGWVQNCYAKMHKKGSEYDPSVLVTEVSMKGEYDKLTQEQKDNYGYEYQLFLALDELVGLCDRKILRNHERLEMKAGAKVSEDDVKQLVEIETKLREKTELAERMGEEGEVDESMKIMQEVESLREIKNTIERGSAEVVVKNPKGQTTICEMTGDIIDGAAAADDLWMKSHFEGKEYQGWKTLRERLVELKAKNSGRGPSRGQSGYRHDGSHGSRDRDSDRHRDKGRDRHGDRRGRDRSRDRRDRSHRDRDRDRRDRDRDRRDRDRDRDRDRRDRSRDK